MQPTVILGQGDTTPTRSSALVHHTVYTARPLGTPSHTGGALPGHVLAIWGVTQRDREIERQRDIET